MTGAWEFFSFVVELSDLHFGQHHEESAEQVAALILIFDVLLKDGV